MRKRGIFRLSLVLTVFLAQWVLFAHAYQDHDSGQPCEICVSASQIGNTVTPSTPVIADVRRAVVSRLRTDSAVAVSLRGEAPRVRGPPTFLSLLK